MTYSNNQEYYLHLLIFTAVSSLALCCIIYLLETSRLQETMLDQLKNAEKLNAINQLAASVAHEIRNPMTTINGFLQMLKDEDNLTKDQHMYISISLTELDRTHNIINDFLSLSRPSNIHTGIFSVSTSLIEIADFMRPYSAYSNVEIIVHIDENLTMIGNRSEFSSLILNFLKNGIESMEHKGGKLHLISFLKDNMVIIKIKDEGCGLTHEQLKQLGQPYYSTKTKGTGLGLMISFDIIKRMNGKHEVYSKLDEGTCFILQFPFAVKS